MRIALYGALLLAGAAGLAMRPADRDERRSRAIAGPPALQLGGRTDEGLPAAARTYAGGVESLRLRWRMSCRRDASPAPSSIGFYEGFERRGRGFWVGGDQFRRFADGRTLVYRADVTGAPATDGRSISGRATLIETWYRDGRVVDRCRSRDVRWRVGRVPHAA